MTDRLVSETREAVAALTAEASLRELASLFGVSHNAIWKLLQGHDVRPSTLRRIRQGLLGSEEAEAFDRLQGALATLLRPRGATIVRKMERRLAAAATEGFEEAGLSVPPWVRWLEAGKRSPATRTESVEELVTRAAHRQRAERRAQTETGGGARALKHRRSG